MNLERAKEELVNKKRWVPVIVLDIIDLLVKKSKFTIGGIVAIVLSWVVNHSVFWAILHFFCGWFYVIYWVLTKTEIYEWLQSLVKQNIT